LYVYKSTRFVNKKLLDILRVTILKGKFDLPERQHIKKIIGLFDEKLCKAYLQKLKQT